MNFKVIPTPTFAKSLKALAKRYRSMKADMDAFRKSLEEDPFQGTELTPGVRKIRMAITSKGGGKSGGARVITYNVLTAEQDGKVYLMEIYDHVGKLLLAIFDVVLSDLPNHAVVCVFLNLREIVSSLRHRIRLTKHNFFFIFCHVFEF